MTKKDYQGIAELLAQRQPVAAERDVDPLQFGAFEMWFDICERFAEYCERDNPRFKRETFMVACANGPVR